MSKLLEKVNRDNLKCLNCQVQDFQFKRGYCSKCYPLILKIEKIKEGILPSVFNNFQEGYYSLDKIKKEYIRQIQWRLELVRDSRTLKDVSAHDLECRINGTLRRFDGKTLGKINDPLAHYLKDDRARAYVHQLFSQIQLLKPFKVDYRRLYEEGSKK